MFENIKGFLFDLDGVLCIGSKPIKGAIDLIHLIRRNNVPFRIVTNYTTLSRLSLFNKLTSIGFKIELEHIISAVYAGVLKVRSLNNPRCEFFVNRDALKDYKEFRLDTISPEYIIIGDLDDQWSFEIINDIFNKVITGSKIIALHKGRYFQVSDGLQIDSGAFIKAIEYATFTDSEVIGKPEKAFFQLAIDDIGVSPNNLMMVGDDIVNDIDGAQQLGLKGVLVKTGKYREKLINSSSIKPDYIINSVADLSAYFK